MGKNGVLKFLDFINFMLNLIFLRMKKIIFVAMAAIAVLASCEDKKVERSQVVGNVYTEATEAGFNIVVNTGGENFTTPLNEAPFTKVTYDSKSGLVFGYTGNTFTVFDKIGRERGSGCYTKAEVKDGVVLLAKAEGTTVYVPKTDVILGTFKELKVQKNKFFTKGSNGWSLRNAEGDYILDKSYEKVYIIDMKADDKYDILCYDGKKWLLFGSDGGTYDAASANQAARELKAKNPTEPVGVIDL